MALTRSSNTSTPPRTQDKVFTAGSKIHVVILSHLVLEIYQAFLSPLLPSLINKLGLTLVLAGLLATILNVSGAILQPLFGAYVDRSPLARFIMWGPLVGVAAASLLGLAPNFLVAAVLMVLSGLACAAYHPEATAAVHHATNRGRGLAMSLYMAGGTLGWAIGPLFILAIVNRLGLEYSYLAMIPGVLATAYIWRAGPRRIDNPLNGNGSTGAADHGVTPKSHFRLADLKVNGRALFTLWLIVVLNGTVTQSFATFLPVYWTENGIPSMMTGVWLMIMSLCSASGGILIAMLSDRLGRRGVLAAGLILAAPFLLLFFAFQGTLSWLGLFAGWFILGGVSPITVVTGQELNKSGAAMTAGLMMGFGWAGGGLMVTAVGALADHIGTGPALRSLLVLPVAAAALAYLMPKRPISSLLEARALT